MKISTHTLLAGRDRFAWIMASVSFTFLLTRPSRGATERQICQSEYHGFLLTRPSRGATRITLELLPMSTFLLTRPSRGATEGDDKAVMGLYHFYSHAPRGARHIRRRIHTAHEEFLLTRPSRGATYTPPNPYSSRRISTHTPLAGRDMKKMKAA